MKLIPGLICAGVFCVGTLLADSPVTLTIDAKEPGYAIPADFIGLSFETSNLLPDKSGKYLFSGDNKQLIALFRNTGIKNLRIGGGTAEIPSYAVPGFAEIDKLFAFAEAADVKIIYTLRLLNGDPQNAAAIAKYIEQHYSSRLSCFAIGNEPDWRSYHSKDPKIKDYPSYLEQWQEFATNIIAATPAVTFGGPDTGSDYPIQNAVSTDFNGESWTQHFADDEKNSRFVTAIFQHDYIGQNAKGVGISTAIDAMLSTNWIAHEYPALFEHVLARAQADGLPYRMTECNDYTGGVDGASNAFASALWALDYMHWQAAHRAAGVNFHNKRWIYTDTICPDAAGNFRVNPKAYGIRAFELGGHGNVESIAMSNPEGMNLTAYAVRDGSDLFVTVINKDHGSQGCAANVTIESNGNARRAETIALAAPNGDPAAKTGVTLGGDSIASDHSWQGKWETLEVGSSGKYELKIPATSAAVVKIAKD